MKHFSPDGVRAPMSLSRRAIRGALPNGGGGGLARARPPGYRAVAASRKAGAGDGCQASADSGSLRRG
ncbi:MAG TPA: hypothetical protein VG432_12495, partial [Gemmatimonadaceae bacterium]|nr:hypothetical protein [Gemmatimonadaceae bacterium]